MLWHSQETFKILKHLQEACLVFWYGQQAYFKLLEISKLQYLYKLNFRNIFSRGFEILKYLQIACFFHLRKTCKKGFLELKEHYLRLT